MWWAKLRRITTSTEASRVAVVCSNTLMLVDETPRVMSDRFIPIFRCLPRSCTWVALSRGRCRNDTTDELARGLNKQVTPKWMPSAAVPLTGSLRSVPVILITLLRALAQIVRLPVSAPGSAWPSFTRIN
jgi:hypothetical protein